MSQPVLPFYHLPPRPGSGRLVVLDSLASLPILVMIVTPAMIPGLVYLRSLSGAAMLDVVGSSPTYSAHIVIASRPNLIGVICLGLGIGGGPGLYLTSIKHTPTFCGEPSYSVFYAQP